MKDERPSFTAAFVAGCRGLTSLLPLEARLAEDPYGLRFAGGVARAIDRVVQLAPGVAQAVLPLTGPLAHTMIWLQVRTRLIDDVVRAFVRDGGRQVVLLGAGFDARASRLAEGLGTTVVFEVDHPATQRRKREVLAEARAPSARVEYVAWNFEHEPMELLPKRLAQAGHDARRPTLTIWEGVTTYLTEPAIDASARTVADYSAPGSTFAVTYFDRARVMHPSPTARIAAAFVASIGEPVRFGWDPQAFPSWMAARGFEVVSNDRDVTLAHRYGVPPRLVVPLVKRGGYVAVAKRPRAH